MSETKNILFLCTGNSARSIMAEAIANRIGEPKYRAFSAGSDPKGEVHPKALKLLRSLDYDLGFARSKSWDEFARDGAPTMHYVFTVCDNAAGEVCPIWPGQPVTAHLGIPDPAAATGSKSEIRAAFSDAYQRLYDRISTFIKLDMDRLSPEEVTDRLEEIHEVL